ncbi:hypothetical protein WJ95_32680 [Burkholderia ubonensis]|nr:hypothetical protein WJ95_32680 [Burkholderia ubonensis]
MNPSPELNSILKQLRLSGILDSLEQRNRQAIDGQLAYTEFLAMLLHDEVARREHKKLGTRLLRAGIAMGKTLESFDFGRSCFYRGRCGIPGSRARMDECTRSRNATSSTRRRLKWCGSTRWRVRNLAEWR